MLLVVAMAAACSRSAGPGPMPGLSVTGVVEVLSQGGMETVILTESGTGEVWALAGDVSSELRESWGQTVTVLGTRPDPAVDDSGRPRLEVLDYVMEGEADSGSSEP